MIKELSVKQKIIIGVAILLFLIIGAMVFFYIYYQEQNSSSVSDLLLLENSSNSENIANTDNVANVENEQSEISTDNENSKKIVVHIMGEVKKTGIIYLKEGSRIADAIEAAGGTTKEADIDAINLAYVLQDGQKLNIPNKKDREKENTVTYITSESGNNVISEENTTAGGENKKVNINEATKSDLETLPGIGSSIASRIIEYREQNGKFKQTDDLKNVKGIGDSKFEKIKDKIFVK